MEFNFSEDQRLLQQTVRDFLEGACPVERLRDLWETETGRSPELWRELSEVGLFFWLLTFAILTRAAMTLYHVPHLALGAELTQDFEERTSIVGYRQAFGYLGGLTAAVCAFGYFMADSRGGRLEAAN